KVPSPLPRSTLTLLLEEFAVARSWRPSPLKSPTATDVGSIPAAKWSGAKKLGSARVSRASRFNRRENRRDGIRQWEMRMGASGSKKTFLGEPNRAPERNERLSGKRLLLDKDLRRGP